MNRHKPFEQRMLELDEARRSAKGRRREHDALVAETPEPPSAKKVEANTRPDRILPARVAMIEAKDRRAGRLFTTALHSTKTPFGPKGKQLILPGFERAVKGPALPLVLYDLGVGSRMERGPAAPLALRLFVEAVLSVPLEERATDTQVYMEITLRDLLARLYPGKRRPRPNEYWPRLMAAIDALDEAWVPWRDPKTKRGGLRRIVTVSNIPDGPGALDGSVRLTVDLPPGSGEGPIVTPRLAYFGTKSAPAYRALLGLAYRWFYPGVTRVPSENGLYWIQVQDPRRYPVVTDQDAIEICFPTSTHRQRKVLVHRAWNVLHDLQRAGEVSITHDRRLMPPLYLTEAGQEHYQRLYEEWLLEQSTTTEIYGEEPYE